MPPGSAAARGWPAFDGTSLADGRFARKPFGDFFAFEQTLTNGVYVAAGDLNGDGFAEVIVGGGPAAARG